MQSIIFNKPAWYIDEAGNLNMHKLLDNFTQFFRENSQMWLKDSDYKESGPHLILMIFLQRIINGGGIINREFALGTQRADLLITWPVRRSLGEVGKKQKIVIELKINYGADTLPKGLKQTAAYMDTCNATEGHLVIFDRDPHKTWEEKIAQSKEHFENKTIHIWQM